MNGVTNNNQPTSNTTNPTVVPAQPTQPVQPAQAVQPVITSSTVQSTPVITQATPTPAVAPAVAAPAQPSLGANVVIAPPQAEPINASTNNQAAAVNTAPPAPTQPAVEEKKEQVEEKATEEPANNVTAQAVDAAPPKKKSPFFIILLILILIGLNVYQYLDTKSKVQKLEFECTPVSTFDKEKELDLNSTIVRDLYNKVKTTIREDLAHMDFDDELKRYLTYRQIPTSDFYDSNCNYFDNTAMQLYTCPTSKDFHPYAFKVETFEREYKKLFGANTTVPNGNIQLGNKCLGGYQYIEERGEYVQGSCKENIPTSFKATKKLTKAISRNNAIILTEEVQYKGTDTQTVPDYLENGTYTYTFKLDTNYNYVYVSREFTPKY